MIARVDEDGIMPLMATVDIQRLNSVECSVEFMTVTLMMRTIANLVC